MFTLGSDSMAFSNYIPTMSTSTFTGFIGEVSLFACAVSITPNIRSESLTVVIVNDAPSNVTKPLSMK